MGSPVDKIQFVVDENLLRFGKALSQLRDDVCRVGQPPVVELLPAGIGDDEWIPIVGGRGWVAITNDKRLRTRPVEASLAVRHRLKVVHLHGTVGTQTAWAQMVRFATRWPAVENHVRATPDGPWWLSLRADRLRILTFEPGAAERA